MAVDVGFKQTMRAAVNDEMPKWNYTAYPTPNS